MASRFIIKGGGKGGHYLTAIMNRGTFAALGAYILWGLLPVFWKSLGRVPALEILCHRITWSLVFLVLLLTWRRQWSWLRAAVQNRRTWLTFTLTAMLLSLNWYTYIWAVNHDFVVETSLGYFINPLINVLLGVIFLRERPRLMQWLAIGLAIAGVGYLTFNYGGVPWIALTLAFSFGFYGLLRKTAPLGSLEGLSLEIIFLFIPALSYLLFLENQGSASFAHISGSVSILLALAGVVTAVPLLLFAYAARRVTLTSLGLMQYVAPSMHFFLGVFIYRESFPAARRTGFSLIWLALLIYTLESLWRQRARR